MTERLHLLTRPAMIFDGPAPTYHGTPEPEPASAPPAPTCEHYTGEIRVLDSRGRWECTLGFTAHVAHLSSRGFSAEDIARVHRMHAGSIRRLLRLATTGSSAPTPTPTPERTTPTPKYDQPLKRMVDGQARGFTTEFCEWVREQQRAGHTVGDIARAHRVLPAVLANGLRAAAEIGIARPSISQVATAAEPEQPEQPPMQLIAQLSNDRAEKPMPAPPPVRPPHIADWTERMSHYMFSEAPAGVLPSKRRRVGRAQSIRASQYRIENPRLRLEASTSINPQKIDGNPFKR